MTAQITAEQKNKIYDKIHWGMDLDNDRLPGEVIREDFGGDEDAYLLAMAGHLDIPLN